MPSRNRLFAAIAATIFTLLAFAAPLSAQSWQWVREGNGSSNDVVGGAALDTLGNVYTVGTFDQNIAFGSTIFTNNTSTGLFLVKYNAGGVYQWALAGLGAGNFLNAAVAVSKSGDVFIAGTYAGTVRIGNDTLRTVAGTEGFVARFSNGGTRRWIQRTALGPGNGYVRGVAVDNLNNCYITGFFSDTASFDTLRQISTGGTDVFAAKYDRNGAILWSTRLGGPGNDEAHGIGIDGTGNAYVAGRFVDSVMIPADTIHSFGGIDAFVAKFSPLGAPTWMTPLGGAQSDVAWGIAVDAFGNSHITGAVADTAHFDTLNVVARGGTDAFVAKVDGLGEVRWAQGIGSGNEDVGYGIALDEVGSVYVTGMAADTAHMAALVLPIIPNNADVFVIKLNGTGSGEWVRGAGGKGRDEGRAIVVDKAGEMRVCGMFADTAHIGPFTSVSTGLQDVFIAKLGADPTVTVGLIVEDRFCTGDQFQIPFSVKGVFGNDNYYVAQLSDSGGSFANPIEIGRIFGVSGTIIIAKLPDTIPQGLRYRVRVMSTAPVVYSDPNPVNLAIYRPPTPVVTPGGPITICKGDSVVLDAGAGYTTYFWNNTERTRRIVVNTSGEYACTVSNDRGCTGTSPRVIVRVITAAKPTINRTGNVLESSEAVAYQWRLRGNPVTGGTNRTFSPAEDGVYTVQITDSNGCTALSDGFEFKRGAGVDATVNTLAGVLLYPHPNAGIFTVRFPMAHLGRVVLTVTDALGRRLASWDDDAAGAEYSRRVDISAFPAGLYFVRIESPSGVWTGETVKR